MDVLSCSVCTTCCGRGQPRCSLCVLENSRFECCRTRAVELGIPVCCVSLHRALPVTHYRWRLDGEMPCAMPLHAGLHNCKTSQPAAMCLSSENCVERAHCVTCSRNAQPACSSGRLPTRTTSASACRRGTWTPPINLPAAAAGAPRATPLPPPRRRTAAMRVTRQRLPPPPPRRHHRRRPLGLPPAAAPGPPALMRTR